MATKTISLEVDAYERLRAAKRSERESFSSVVRRGSWDNDKYKAQNVLAGLDRLFKENPRAFLPDKTLNEMLRRRRTIRPKSRCDE